MDLAHLRRLGLPIRGALVETGSRQATRTATVARQVIGNGCNRSARGLAFHFEPQPAGFSPLYVARPERHTAATNAGDYRLYLGGGAINRAFGDLLKKSQGLVFGKTSDAYASLHRALLAASRGSSGALVSAAQVPDAASLLSELRLAASFGQAGEILDGDSPGLEGSTGSVFVDVFEAGARPLHEGNVAMLYVVGPKGEECKGPRQEGSGQLLDRSAFLHSIERLGRRSLEVVAEYNRRREGDSELPAIEEVRWCLVSGGVYCHGHVTKVEVAEATLRGMMTASSVEVAVTFAYDEDVFNLAREKLRAKGGE